MATKTVKQLGHLPMLAVLASLIYSSGGKNSIKMIEVADTANNYFETAGKDLTPEQIFRALIDVDADGDFAIRYASVTNSGSHPLTVSAISESQLVRLPIGKTATGKPFLRLAIQSL